MPRSLGALELRNILKGATFYGGGGGGSLADGIKLLDGLGSERTEAIRFFDMAEMKPEEFAVMVAGIGSPKSFNERTSFEESITAFKAMQRVLAAEGRSLQYLMSGEMGGLNTAVPLYVAASEGLPMLDADGNGRAVPEIATCLCPLNDIPSSPLVMASSKGDVVVVELADPLDATAAENIARHVAVAYGMVAAFSTWPVDRASIEAHLVPGGLSQALFVGEALSSAEDVVQLGAALEQAIGARLLTVGTIVDIAVKVEGGFDFGVTTIKGDDGRPGVEIAFKNENMLLMDAAHQVIATVPDIITLVDADTLLPLTNADTKMDQRVAVFGVRAHPNWYAKPRGFDCWKAILGKLGYDGPQMAIA